MFTEIFLFELNYRLKRPATWAYFGILFLYGMIISIGGFEGGSEKVFLNAPTNIASTLNVVSIFGIMLASAIMGVPIYRDIEHGTQNYLFSYPISEKGYVSGRFAGSMLTLFLVSLGLILGFIIGYAIGPYAGFEPAERYADFNFWHYLQPSLVFYWSNFFFSGCIFFALVALTKRIMLAYAGGAILFIVYLVTLTLTQDIENKELVSLLDPFGFGALNNTIQYWTPDEQNTLTVPFKDTVMWNRILWVGIGLLICLFTVFRFDFQRFLTKKLGSKKKVAGEVDGSSAAVLTKIPVVSQVFSRSHNVKMLGNLAWMEFRNITKDLFFKAILIAAVGFLFFDGWFGNPTYGTPMLPMTYYMLEIKDYNYVVLIFILIVFMTGEVLHRERSVKYDQIYGALPLPNWVVYGSKFLALVFICFVLVNMILVSGLLNQILQGYYNFQFDMYFTDLYLIEFPKYISYVMLAFFVHAVIAKKFLGHVITIAIWAALFAISSLADIDYNMYLYGYAPGYTISDMNGFGHFLSGQNWFRLYWLGFGFVLAIVGLLFWKRGTDSGIKARWKEARHRFGLKEKAAMIAGVLVCAGAGWYVHYNVSELNSYRTVKQGRELAANYEKDISKYNYINQPKFTDVKVEVDLVPEERYATMSGTFTMVNKGETPIDSLHLNWGDNQLLHTELLRFSVGDIDLKEGKVYSKSNYKLYKLPNTMMPGDTLVMNLAIKRGYKGFPNEGSGSDIVYNGTFLKNDFFPTFGYNLQYELTSDKYRKEYDLPVKEYTAPPQNDKWGLRNLLFNDDADYVTFEGTVSTAPDQIAIMPGYLQKEWEENGRKYYHYKMEGEMDYFFNVSSARYDIHKEDWTGKNGEKVVIEIFHHPDHPYNVKRFAKAVCHSLDYFSENYGPYQYRQMRIIEFPRYQSFAQSFPNTVPYAESFGWTGDFSDPEDLDYAYMVTSHEVAHQWWGHQITPSATRGANQISESMAEYSSLMVMKKEYGVDAMQDFLKRELDSYLRGRAGENKFEKTLLDNDTQAYVWYRKGGSVLYALQDYIGENQLNLGFKKFIDSAAFRSHAPFATSNEWYGYIKEVTPDSLQYFLEDSFEKITLYTNKVNEATFKKLDNDSYEIKLTVESEKNYYDGNGKDLGAPDQPNLLDIAVFQNDTIINGKTKKVPLILEKKWIKPGTSTFTFITSKKPFKAGIDPYNKMIDRIPDDNLISLEEME
ncbi:Peptidase family M1 [Maribacter dokdonensis]|uniref:Peptidase family M1 n=1 Tax=Maribacter dokdonensis TaxID=320912 RepID=A0ABY0UZV8_9FLAO|nr:M1 family aminopeptidase [Maribacter dokdonensis]SDT44601.1 Peptidase family M1 [Maribacter dokdonensis]